MEQNLSFWDCDPAQYVLSENLFPLIKVLWLKHFEHQFSNPNETALMETCFMPKRKHKYFFQTGQDLINPDLIIWSIWATVATFKNNLFGQTGKLGCIIHTLLLFFLELLLLHCFCVCYICLIVPWVVWVILSCPELHCG